jgi:hypothetical protein
MATNETTLRWLTADPNSGPKIQYVFLSLRTVTPFAQLVGTYLSLLQRASLHLCASGHSDYPRILLGGSTA